MKVALIGDVHANLPALEAVLAHIQAQHIDTIWNVGDWVGYNAFPNEVVDSLRQMQAVSIVGNYDLKVLKFKKKKETWRHSKRPEKYLAFKWAYKTLTKENRNYLRSLPKERLLHVDSHRILLTHGSPAAIDEPLTLETPVEHLRTLAQMTDANIIICGHSHRPFARQVDDVWFINTGSVGRPDNGDPRTVYAVLQLEQDSLHVEHHRLAYDVDRAVAGIRQHNLPEAFAQMLLQGRNLGVE